MYECNHGNYKGCLFVNLVVIKISYSKEVNWNYYFLNNIKNVKYWQTFKRKRVVQSRKQIDLKFY